MISALLVLALVQNGGDVERLIDAHGQAHGVAGIAVAVADQNRISESFWGMTDLQAGDRVGVESKFRFASISKPITAALVMRAVEAGKLNLDQDVRSYVKSWKKPGITLRMILGHRSGIRHYRPDRKDAGFEVRTTEEAIALFADDDLVFEPGSKYAYSTHAYTVAAGALEAVNGKPFVQQVAEFTASIGAGGIVCESWSEGWPKNRSRHYQILDGKPLPAGRAEDLSWKYAGGGMEGTAKDLAQFGHQMRRGMVVSAQSLKELWSDPEGDGYGLGWAVDSDMVSHSGSQQGARSMLIIDSRNQLVVAVLTNTGPNPAGELAKSVRTARLGSSALGLE